MDQKLIINDFLIRYTYTSFITTNDIDFRKLAINLLEDKVASCVFIEDNIFGWVEDNAVFLGIPQFSKNDNCYVLIDEKRNQLKLPTYINNLYKKLINKRAKENSIIHHDGSIRFLDFYTDPIKFTNGEDKLIIQPYIKIFKDSITIIKYEIEKEDLSINTEYFIKNYVNLISSKYDTIYCSPHLCSIFIESFQKKQKTNFFQRAILLRNLIISNEEVNKKIKKERFNNVLHSFVEIPNAKNNSLSDLTISLITTIEYQLLKPKNNFLYLIRGYNKIHDSKNLWVGRPYIYINKYENMKEKGSENNSFYGYEFQYIMNRNISKDLISIKNDSKSNLRLNDDSLYFSNSSVSLFLNGKYLYDSGKYKDLLRTLETTEDYLEYGYMINKSLLSLVQLSKTPEEINKLRWKSNYLVDFDLLTYYGEVRHWFREGLKTRNIEVIKIQTKEAFEIRLQEGIYTNDERNYKTNITLTIVFGTLATVSIAEFITEPLLKHLKIFSNSESYFLNPISFFITFGVISFMLLLYLCLKRNK